MELIATQSEMKYVDEPLHPDNLISARRVESESVGWNFSLPHPKRKQILFDYFTAIEANRVHVGEPRFMSPFYRVFTNRIVFKILRAKDLVSWFEDAFGWQIVYLIRHPLATSISRKSFPRLELFLDDQSFVNDNLTPQQIQLCRTIVNAGSNLERAVLDWCLQNIIAIRLAFDRGWLCMHYEDLISDAEAQTHKLCNFLQLSQPERMIKRLACASGSTIQSDRETRSFFDRKNENRQISTEFLLSKWRSKLTADDEKRAFEVLEAFEIDLYCRGLDIPVRRLQSKSQLGSQSPRELCQSGTQAG